MSEPKFKRVPVKFSVEIGRALNGIPMDMRDMKYVYERMVAAAPPDSTVTDWCACGDGYPQDSWDAGFMAAMGKCANCVAADGDA